MNQCIRIEYDETAPNAAIELTILHPLPDYDLDEVEAVIPRDVDVMLASQGFHDLVDEARTILSSALRGGELEVMQLTGAICNALGSPALRAAPQVIGQAYGWCYARLAPLPANPFRRRAGPGSQSR